MDEMGNDAPRPHHLVLGRVLATPGAVELIGAGVPLWKYLIRHACGDWGDLDEHDRAANARAVQYGGERVLSAYRVETGARLWIITEADRSATTLLLPSEY